MLVKFPVRYLGTAERFWCQLTIDKSPEVQLWLKLKQTELSLF